MIIKTAQNVCLKGYFRITGYSLRSEYINIAVLNESQVVISDIFIPLYISELGIYPKEIGFVMPGDHLPTTHADYYETVVSNSGQRKVRHNNTLYDLRFSKDFRLTGKYYLVNTTTGEQKTLRARKKTVQDIKDAIETYIDETMPGNIIGGVVIKLYYTNEKEILRFVSFVDTEYMQDKKNIKAFAIIRDIQTNVEYTLNVNYLKVV